jgi:hypothetical protein
MVFIIVDIMGDSRIVVTTSAMTLSAPVDDMLT